VLVFQLASAWDLNAKGQFSNVTVSNPAGERHQTFFTSPVANEDVLDVVADENCPTVRCPLTCRRWSPTNHFPLRESYCILGLCKLCREIHKLGRVASKVQNGRGIYSFWYLGMQPGNKESFYVDPITERP
jgi:hypothetical protein